MAKDIEDVIKELPPERQELIKERTQELQNFMRPLWEIDLINGLWAGITSKFPHYKICPDNPIEEISQGIYDICCPELQVAMALWETLVVPSKPGQEHIYIRVLPDENGEKIHAYTIDGTPTEFRNMLVFDMACYIDNTRKNGN